MLTLIRVQTDSLDFISDWRDLGRLLLYGCNFSDWSQLSHLKKLKYLLINSNRSRTLDLSFLSELKHLEELCVVGIRHWTSFPDMSGCRRLKRLSIFECPRLRDLSTILQIPILASFHIAATPQQPTDLTDIMAMPKMKFMTGAFGTKDRNDLFRELLAKYNLAYGG